MAERGRLPLHLTGPARRDLAAIVKRSFREFGEAAALRYEALIRQALEDCGRSGAARLERTAGTPGAGSPQQAS